MCAREIKGRVRMFTHICEKEKDELESLERVFSWIRVVHQIACVSKLTYICVNCIDKYDMSELMHFNQRQHYWGGGGGRERVVGFNSWRVYHTH